MSWDTILGQDHAIQLLQSRLKNDQTACAYLLIGPDGVGKRQVAEIMCRAIICEQKSIKPCGECARCRQVDRGTHPDVHRLIPAGSAEKIGIQEVRQLISRINLKPFGASAQVVIIEAAHRMTIEAANSLLKSLEEPSKYTTYLLLTEQLSQCLPTIVSRCQRINFHRLSAKNLEKILIQKHDCNAEIASTVSLLARGSASRALHYMEHWKDRNALTKRLASGKSIDWIKQPLPDTRQGVVELLDDMVEWLRDLAVTSAIGLKDLIHGGQEKALELQAHKVDPDRCVDAAIELLKIRNSIEHYVNPRLAATLARECWLSLVKSVEG